MRIEFSFLVNAVRLLAGVFFAIYHFNFLCGGILQQVAVSSIIL